MNKRGVVSLEALVKFIPHLLITIGLLALFVAMVAIWTATPKTTEEQDFRRILAEVDEFAETEYSAPEIVRVPIDSESVLRIVTYPGNAQDLPQQCQRQSCICLYYAKESKLIERCKMYSEIKSGCQFDECGPVCFGEVKQLSLKPEDTVVAVTRGCNEITIT